ncbi:hypothetical protein [Cellulosimicrobium cellulans]|uniref:Lipoprotein n=1 Tax=Cellulosimicrobium cellulans TaxID=1710 RepID=A0A4Y4E1P8_CELCE|nr:hypothetical protein [Cellulosimicrobium cellulans]GED11532.1 hypothetical protein CCE02nite_35310 [Cellulosimicrobium cellulans]
MTRASLRAGALAAGLVVGVLGAGACTGSPTPEGPTSGPSATRTREAPGVGPSGDPTITADPDVASGAPGEPTAGSSTGPGDGASGPAAPEITSLGGTPATAPLVARAGWQVVGASGGCVLPARGTGDPETPTAGARDASAALLAETVSADGGDPDGAPRDVLLPVGSDGVAVQGVNAVAQDWTVESPRGPVQVRGAARVVAVPAFDGSTNTQSVVLALDCPAPFDEGAWQRLLADVRVGLVAPVEALGTWPS